MDANPLSDTSIRTAPHPTRVFPPATLLAPLSALFQMGSLNNKTPSIRLISALHRALEYVLRKTIAENVAVVSILSCAKMVKRPAPMLRRATNDSMFIDPYMNARNNIFDDLRTTCERRLVVDSPCVRLLDIIMAENTIFIASARRRHSCFEYSSLSTPRLYLRNTVNILFCKQRTIRTRNRTPPKARIWLSMPALFVSLSLPGVGAWCPP
mmetsp:Transcript_7094/g.15498  ORF Transcript_7094/g.15498 Transcript_7094/m.15498 type:complete len:211 (-) Transcript_7094:269-901(-)